MAMSTWPTSERPREKLINLGPEALSDAELLAIFLRTGRPGASALDMARELISHFGSLKALMDASFDQFCAFSGMGSAKYAQLHASLEMSKRYFLGQMQAQDVVRNPDDCRRYVRLALKGKVQEVFACLFLNSQNHIISFDELFYGTLDSAVVYPREVVRRALEKGAAAVILCHNHPSGVAEPSQADEAITRRLSDALALVDIKVLDHLVVAGNHVESFAERGLI